MRLGVVEYFDSAHYLPQHDSCGRMHGHTYKVEVVIEGEKKEDKMIMDFHEVKMKVRTVIAELDHRSINEILDYPSAENITEYIFRKLKKEFDYPLRVRVWEGKGKWIEISEY